MSNAFRADETCSCPQRSVRNGHFVNRARSPFHPAQRLSIVLVSPVLLWEEARWQWALQRCSRLVFEIFLGVQQPCRR